MNILNKEEMLEIKGGASISSAMLNALMRTVSVMFSLGQAVGSAIRRSLGKNYTKETIAERIQKQQISKNLPTDNPSYLQHLIDTSTLKKILTSDFKNGSLKKIWKLLLEHIIR